MFFNVSEIRWVGENIFGADLKFFSHPFSLFSFEYYFNVQLRALGFSTRIFRPPGVSSEIPQKSDMRIPGVNHNLFKFLLPPETIIVLLCSSDVDWWRLIALKHRHLTSPTVLLVFLHDELCEAMRGVCILTRLFWSFQGAYTSRHILLVIWIA